MRVAVWKSEAWRALRPSRERVVRRLRLVWLVWLYPCAGLYGVRGVIVNRKMRRCLRLRTCGGGALRSQGSLAAGCGLVIAMGNAECGRSRCAAFAAYAIHVISMVYSYSKDSEYSNNSKHTEKATKLHSDKACLITVCAVLRAVFCYGDVSVSHHSLYSAVYYRLANTKTLS